MIIQIFLLVLFLIPDIIINGLGVIFALGFIMTLCIGDWRASMICLALLISLPLLHLFVGGGWKLLLYLFLGGFVVLVVLPLAIAIVVGLLLFLFVVCTFVFLCLQSFATFVIKQIRKKFA